MDDTLGTMGLPAAALVIAVVFRWLAPSRIAAAKELAPPGTLLAVLTKYLVPLVLATIGTAQLLSSAGFAGWHVLPGGGHLDRLPRDVATVVIISALLAATLTVVALLRRWGRHGSR
jgi:NSS family neurotransmitter:Na+ symporter